jgi:hypothetical protein
MKFPEDAVSTAHSYYRFVAAEFQLAETDPVLSSGNNLQQELGLKAEGCSERSESINRICFLPTVVQSDALGGLANRALAHRQT